MTLLLHRAETLEAAVDRIIREETDTTTNVVLRGDVSSAISDWLEANPSRITKVVRDNAAQKALDRYLARHRAKMDGGQYAIFQPYYLIPLGQSRYAWLDLATLAQVVEWKETLLAAFARTRATHEEKIRQIDARILKWGNHTTFGEVERAEFGWTQADFKYDDDDDAP
jgi:hypothetical protein